MFQINVDNKIFYTSTAPNYVKKKLESGAWIKSSKDDAEGIAVLGEIYSLPNKPPIENKAVANVKEIDGGTIIFEMSNKTKDNALKVVDIQEALCDLSEELEALKDG